MNCFYFALALATLFAYRAEGDSCSPIIKQYSACTAKEEQNFASLEAKVKKLGNEVTTLKARDYGCQSGSALTHYITKGTMNYNFVHTFTKAFKGKPAFAYGFSHLDIFKGHNARVNTKLISLTNTGFKLNLYTWHTTLLYRAGVSWMACPQA